MITRGMKPFLILMSTLLLIPSLCSALDSQRKGVVLGLSIGYTPVASWSESNRDINETNSGWAGGLLAGYAPNNRDMLLFQGIFTRSRSDALHRAGLSQAVSVLQWNHYWGASDRAVFSSIGVGLATLDTNEPSPGLEGRGIGFLLGGGYHIAKHVQIGIYYNGGQTDEDDSVNASHNHITLLVTGMVY